MGRERGYVLLIIISDQREYGPYPGNILYFRGSGLFSESDVGLLRPCLIFI